MADWTAETEVERLLVAAADHPDDPDAGDAFAAALLTSTVGVAGTASDQGFAPLVRAYESGQYAVAFTHQLRWEQFVTTAPDLQEGSAQLMPIVVRDLFGHLVNGGLPLLLNPTNPYGKEFTVPEMSDRLQGIRPGTQERVVGHAQTVQVGAPAYVPEGLVDRLTAHLHSVGGVDTATLAWIRYPDGLQGYLLGIRGQVRREQVLTPAFNQVVGNLEGRTLDVMFADPGAGLVTDSVEPFLS